MKKVFLVLAVLLLGLSLSACQNKWEIADDATEITVAASPTPHTEILKQCIPLMAEKGYTLKIKEFTDYVLPNTATEDGSVDANYFQHTPYLEEFNELNKTHLVSVGKIHYEPFGIYAGKANSLENLAVGSKIIVPNDGTNEARALLLLEQVGLITLKEGVGLSATKIDIADDHGYEIIEAEAAAIPNLRQDAELVVLNGNYALGANLSVSDALAVEASEGLAAQTYANILVVREGNENKAIVLALLECLQSETIKSYINNTYNGSVVPVK